MMHVNIPEEEVNLCCSHQICLHRPSIRSWLYYFRRPPGLSQNLVWLSQFLQKKSLLQVVVLHSRPPRPPAQSLALNTKLWNPPPTADGQKIRQQLRLLDSNNTFDSREKSTGNLDVDWWWVSAWKCKEVVDDPYPQVPELVASSTSDQQHPIGGQIGQQLRLRSIRTRQMLHVSCPPVLCLPAAIQI